MNRRPKRGGATLFLNSFPHFSPGASECELTSEANSLTDGNWPEGSVSLRRLLYYSKLGRQSGLHLSAQTVAPKVPAVSTIPPKAPNVSKVSVLEPLNAQSARGVQSVHLSSLSPPKLQVLGAALILYVMQNNNSKKIFGIKHELRKDIR